MWSAPDFFLKSKNRKGYKLSPEAKARISAGKKGQYTGSGGRCKWFDVNGQRVQGTWERNIAKKFDEMGVRWEKLKINQRIFNYVMDGVSRTYTPDFLLPVYGIFLEIKGYWWGRDKEKMRLIKENYPNTKILIIEQDGYKRILQGELIWLRD